MSELYLERRFPLLCWRSTKVRRKYECKPPLEATERIPYFPIPLPIVRTSPRGDGAQSLFLPTTKSKTAYDLLRS